MRAKIKVKQSIRKKEKDSYSSWKKELAANPAYKTVYKEEAAKKELWLQLVEARLAAGLTQVEMAKRLGVSQAQVARFEKQGYDAYTLTSLRRYIQALGENFSLEVTVSRPSGIHTSPFSIHR